ncbi:MAG: tetratricopeptide repeat protein [Nitrospinae bacterium]|nr:tetratricopeptide repeat protein [Nitrospinota bacterium]
MNSLYQKSRAAWWLALFISLGITGSGCATIERTYSNVVEKIDIQGSFDNARNWLLQEEPDKLKISPQSDLRFARQQYNQKNYAIAEFYLKKTLVHLPDDPTAINLLPWTFFFQKRYDKALVAFERAKTHYPKNPEPLMGMGWCYFGLKDYERALQRFERAGKLAGDPYQIHKGKAFAHLGVNRTTSAREEFSHIYSSKQIDEVLTLWETWHDNDANALIEVIPSTPEAVSLFTLPTEHPRYPGALLGLPRTEDPAVEHAWSAYHRGSYRKALEEFKDVSADPTSPDA